MTYVDLNITADAGELTDLGVGYIAAQEPDWTAVPGNPEVVLLEAVGFIAAQIARMTGRVADEIYRFIGQSLFRVAVIDATYATAETVWTLTDTAGYPPIPAGTQIAIADVAFEVIEDTPVPAGSSTITLTVVAINPGSAGSGLSAPVDVLDALTYIDHVTVTGQTTDGADGETPAEYIDRVAKLTPTFSAKAILADDFELLPTTVPGVDLALAIRNYIPAGPGGIPAEQTGVGGAVTVALRDGSGQPVTTDARDTVDALLNPPDQRIAGIVLSLIGPTYTPIAALFAVDVLPGWDPPTVRLQCIAALADALAPANHGVDQVGETRRHWRDEPLIKLNDLIGVLYRVEGMRHVDSLTIGIETALTIDSSTDVVTSTAHGYANGDPVVFTALTGGAGLTTGTTYYVRDVTTNTFKVAATAGGSAIDITSDATAGEMFRPATGDLTLAGPAGLPTPGMIDGTAA